MAPAFLKQLRRRSKASFKTENSTDTSSEGAGSHGAQSTGSVTPPSFAQQSDPALHTQVKDQHGGSQNRHSRPPVPPLPVSASNSSRNSLGNTSVLGSPSMNGRTSPPLSQYAPRIHNISENSWVSTLETAASFFSRRKRTRESTSKANWAYCRSIKKSYCCMEPLASHFRDRLTVQSPLAVSMTASQPYPGQFATLTSKSWSICNLDRTKSASTFQALSLRTAHHPTLSMLPISHYICYHH